MRLEFKLLVVDDDVESAQAAIRILSRYLEKLGFLLKVEFARDLSADGIRTLTRNMGKDFNLVIIDYSLGTDIDGSEAALFMRRGLPYTDIVFYSSHAGQDLLRLLADRNVSGVFVSNREDLSDTLVGISETIIGKAVDLSHMRGIAMAEVAEMDVLLEDVLMAVYSEQPEIFAKSTDQLLEKIKDGSDRIARKLAPLLEERQLIDIISNGALFSSFQKYQAVRVLTKALPEPPAAHLASLKTYNEDVIDKRNTLAHAKEEVDIVTGSTTLRSIKHGAAPVRIDDAWMTTFRTGLRAHRSSLEAICAAVQAHVELQRASRIATTA